MNCPVCNQPLIILELRQVEIDYCTSCHGIWLDEGELEIFLPDEYRKEMLFNSFKVDKKNGEKKIKCPVCSKKMNKISCGDTKNIVLDECPDKHGFWFNKGELNNVVEMGSLDKENKIVSLLKEMFAYNLNTSPS